MSDTSEDVTPEDDSMDTSSSKENKNHVCASESVKPESISKTEEENSNPDLYNVDYAKLKSDNSEIRRRELNNIAEVALEFQPKGFTLETTQVLFF